ncbi:MAG: aminopeptidase [Candidatus Aenigmatarchaeota archaeon]
MEKLMKDVAKKIVWSMNMKRGESLRISAGLHEQELVEEMIILAMKQGIDVTTALGSDNLSKRVYSEVPTEKLRKTSKLSMKIVEALNNHVAIERLKDPRVAESFPPKKIAAVRESAEPVSKLIEKYNIKTCFVGYPTEEMAEKLGVKFSLLKKFILNGMLIKHNDLTKKADFIRNCLKGAKYAHAYDEYGTDLKILVKGRRPLLDDGLIGDEDIKNKDLHGNLPCGEIFLAPVETYAEGILVSPKRADSFTGKMIENITLVFENGKLNIKKTKAEKNEKALKTTLKSCINIDKKMHKVVRTTNIAELGIGLNPVIDQIIGYLLTDEKIGGTIHVALGENKRFPGGKSESCLHWDFITNKGVNLEAIYQSGKKKMILDKGKPCFS